MFKVHVQEQRIRFMHGEDAVLDGLGVTVRRNDGREETLRLIGMKEERPGVPSGGGVRTSAGRRQAENCTRLTFQSEGEGNGQATVHVDVAVFGSRAAVYVRASLYNKELFRDRVHFAAFDGIVIHAESLPGLTAAMANYQHKDWWTRPHFGTALQELPKRTLSLLWRSGGRFGHLLPVTDRRCRTDLRGGEHGLHIGISAYRGGDSEYESLAFVLGVDSDPYRLVEDNAALALEVMDSPARLRKEKRYPEVLDYLGWCSWDAFYHAVDAAGLLRKTAELHELGLPVRWVMIDDGWSAVREKRLASYDADRSKFPDGIAPVIRKMKEAYGVAWVGVWHTIVGYWGGIDPQGELFAGNRTRLVETGGGAWVPAPDAAQAFGFWNDWHGYLKRQGVDFVKVDSQSAIANFFAERVPIGEAAAAAHTALEASVALHFNGWIINCMGMASENVWHRPSSSVSRNSDDFMPEADHSFREHALQNAYNSFFHGVFYWGDWDMFWTNNPDDKQNMVLRAVSGGPIYFSDKLGRTNPANVWPLVFRDGRVIRCDRPGQPTADCLTTDPAANPVPLKIWNRAGAGGVLAAFHVHPDDRQVSGTFGPADIPGLEGERFLVFDRERQRVFRMRRDERQALELSPGSAELYLFLPESPGDDVTPIGLIDKLVASAAIEEVRRDAHRTVVRLTEGGRFAFALDRAPSEIRVNGVPAASAESAAGLHVVDCGEAEGRVTVELMV
jgi:hypothetical protein